MSSILKRISPISKIKTKILNNRSKISFNLDESEFTLNKKFGLHQPHNLDNEELNPLKKQYDNQEFTRKCDVSE